MTDPIKDALRAAANVIASSEDTCQLRDGSAPCTRHCECHHLAAAAVAAFLRALEDGTIWRPNPFLGNRACPNETLHALAAAVEKAARDE